MIPHLYVCKCSKCSCRVSVLPITSRTRVVRHRRCRTFRRDASVGCAEGGQQVAACCGVPWAAPCTYRLPAKPGRYIVGLSFTHANVAVVVSSAPRPGLWLPRCVDTDTAAGHPLCTAPQSHVVTCPAYTHVHHKREPCPSRAKKPRVHDWLHETAWRTLPF